MISIGKTSCGTYPSWLVEFQIVTWVTRRLLRVSLVRGIVILTSSFTAGANLVIDGA